MQAITAEHGGSAFQFAERPDDRSRLWKARHNSYQAVMALSPGNKNMGTDACVKSGLSVQSVPRFVVSCWRYRSASQFTNADSLF